MHSLKAKIPASRKESIYNAACKVLPAIAYGDAAGLPVEVQQHMLLAVLGASIVLGISLALVMDFIKRISFNAQVIGEQNQAIAMYS